MSDPLKDKQWPPLPQTIHLPLPREAPDKFKGARGHQELEGHEGAEWFLDHLKTTATTFFKQQQQVFPMVLFIASRDFETSEILPQPGIMACAIDPTLMNSEDSKDGFRNWIRVVVTRTEAIGWGFMTEVWMVMGNKPRSELPETLKDVPGRKEMVMITAQHRALEAADNEGADPKARPSCRTVMMLAEIKRGSKKARLADWVTPPADSVSGRFADILTPISKRREADDLFEVMRKEFPRMSKAEMIEGVTRVSNRFEADDPRRHLLPWMVAKIREMDID